MNQWWNWLWRKKRETHPLNLVSCPVTNSNLFPSLPKAENSIGQSLAFKIKLGTHPNLLCIMYMRQLDKVLKRCHYLYVNPVERKNLMPLFLFDFNRGINFPDSILYLFPRTFGHIPLCKLNSTAFTFQLLFPGYVKT